MRLEFKENDIYLVFEVAEDKKLSLLHFSNTPFSDNIEEKKRKWFTAAEIHVTGKNPNDHHGAKHTGSSSMDDLKYVGHKYYQNSIGNKLELGLKDEELQVFLHYQFYEAISVCKTWTEVKNISQNTVGLEYVSSFCLTGIGNGLTREVTDHLKVFLPHNTWMREFDWQAYTMGELGLWPNNSFSMKRIAISNTGTWSSKEYLPMGAVLDQEKENCLMWQIENNGSWHWEISDIAEYFYLKVSGPTENENHWHKELKPGECFESVKAAVVLGKDFDDALKQLTLYRRRIVRKNRADSYLPIIFNDYMNCLKANPTTEKMLPIIDKAAEAGAEYYCMDAGWYADGTWWETVGEWQPCGWRFPNGIREVFDYIRNKGMVPGIWLEIESMGINCPILPQFEDECFFMRHGKRVIDHGRYQLDFRNRKVRDFATSVIDRVVNEYGVGYIKMDYNIDGGLGTEVDADSFGDGLLSHNRVYLSWMKGIMDKYPDLVVETCGSGGLRMDYAQLALHPLQSVTDQPDYRHMIPITAAAATAVLPEQAAIWSYPVAKDDEDAVAVNMINAMLLRMHLSGEISALNEAQFALIQEGVQCYKEIRESISKAIPFYPLGVESYGKDWLCAGYKGENSVYMAVWRLNAEQDTVEIPMDADYREVKVIYPSDNKCQLRKGTSSLLVSLPNPFCGVVIKLW